MTLTAGYLSHLPKPETAVVQPKYTGKNQRAYDKKLYEERDLIKSFITDLERLRVVVTGDDEPACGFIAATHGANNLADVEQLI